MSRPGRNALLVRVVINFTATVAVRKRALTGVRGTSPLSPGEIAVLALAWAAAAVLLGNAAVIARQQRVRALHG